MRKISLLISLCALILSGCGAGWHLKRSELHLKKAIAKGAVIASDTVYIEKPIYIEEISVDTVFRTLEGDTVFISKERLKIKYVDLPGDSVYIEGKCEADTIFEQIPVTVIKEIKAPKGTFEKYAGWIVATLLLLLYLLKITSTSSL